MDRGARETWSAADADLQQYRLDLASLHTALVKLCLSDAQRQIEALDYELKYRPDQPRVPAGYREGGQWTIDGAGTPSAHPRRGGASRLVEGPPRPKNPGTPWDEGKRPVDLATLFGIGTAEAQQPPIRPEWAKNLSKDGLTYYGQKYVPNAQLPSQAQRVLGNAQRTPTPDGMILNLPRDYVAIPAPQGGGILMVPPEYKPGDRQNVVRIQPFGTGSSNLLHYSNGYYVVSGSDGEPISAYSGRTLPRNSPGIHNPYGRMEPPIFKGKSAMTDERNLDRERRIVAEMVGLRVHVTFAQFGFDMRMVSPRGTIRVGVGADTTLTEQARSTTISFQGGPPSPLIGALDGKIITAARLSEEHLTLEFGPVQVRVPHTPDLWSFDIGVNFGESDPLSGLWFF